MDDLLLDDDFGDDDLEFFEVTSLHEPDETEENARQPHLTEARALVKRLCKRNARQPAPRTRIGVLQLAPPFLGDEKNLAVRLGVETVSLAQAALDGAPQASRWLGLDARKALQLLDELAREAISVQRPGECLLLTHADLVLAALSTRERESFWREAFSGLPHRTRALLIALPDGAKLLPPTRDWPQWQESGRSAVVLPPDVSPCD